jgi:hypothetical protein
MKGQGSQSSGMGVQYAAGARVTNTTPCIMTEVTALRAFFCYTAVNAFATVCSLSGDPDGSAPPPHFLPAVWFQR